MWQYGTEKDSACTVSLSDAILTACIPCDLQQAGSSQQVASPTRSGKVFIFYPADYLTWQDARNYCRRQSGDLASISNSQELQAIYTGFTSLDNAWIGLNDNSVEGQFRWADGDTSSYRSFASGQPDDSRGAEDCVTMLSSGLWNDVPCGVTRQFICSKCGNVSCTPVICLPLPCVQHQHLMQGYLNSTNVNRACGSAWPHQRIKTRPFCFSKLPSLGQLHEQSA